jgi:hypothetical protein
MNSVDYHNTYRYIFDGQTDNEKSYFNSGIPPNKKQPTYYSGNYGVAPV